MIGPSSVEYESFEMSLCYKSTLLFLTFVMEVKLQAELHNPILREVWNKQLWKPKRCYSRVLFCHQPTLSDGTRSSRME